ncbi:MAG: 3-dehydroquinate synthase [Tannerella sp.]|jgi:3-dehydroquinate synthase|nr:3-dehydroquinate synthase [Tannerella sp.]
MTEQKIIITRDLKSELQALLASSGYDRLFILADANTQQKCYPLVRDIPALQNARLITIRAGDMHKELEQVSQIWNRLSREGASRNSLLMNLGGGMVTDLGGFAGATFKRGLHTINLPTTLMASVDAAVGGKTGINFNGLKNEIGAFHFPDYVVIDSIFLRTLDQDNLLSGYAEMIKHGLIDSTRIWSDVLTFDPDVRRLDVETLNRLVAESVAVKERIVTEDPKEHGIRKALNFGHTVGHAFESLSFERPRPLLHGHAVAAGLVCELYLSHKCCDFPADTFRQTVQFINTRYPPFVFDCNDYETLYERMTHDKKNENGNIHFTLLAQIGDVRIRQTIDRETVLESLDFYRETSLQ